MKKYVKVYILSCFSSCLKGIHTSENEILVYIYIYALLIAEQVLEFFHKKESQISCCLHKSERSIVYFCENFKRFFYSERLFSNLCVRYLKNGFVTNSLLEF